MDTQGMGVCLSSSAGQPWFYVLQTGFPSKSLARQHTFLFVFLKKAIGHPPP